MDPFIGEIILFSSNFAPRGWAFCDGRLLSISQNSRLFSVIGNKYGGDPRSTFKLPDLRGRTAISPGQGPGLYSYPMGNMGGEESNQVTGPQMPGHNHGLAGEVTVGINGGDPSTEEANGSTLGNTSTGNLIYNGQPASRNKKLAGVSHNLSTVSLGGGLPLNNMQPFQVLGYIIALEGVLPSKT